MKRLDERPGLLFAEKFEPAQKNHVARTRRDGVRHGDFPSIDGIGQISPMFRNGKILTFEQFFVQTNGAPPGIDADPKRFFGEKTGVERLFVLRTVGR